MNNRTAHIQFKVLMDKNAQGVAYGGAPAFLPEEEDIFLNQAQDEIVSNKISGNNALQTGFEGNMTRMSELDVLVMTDKDLPISRVRENEFTLTNLHDSGRRMLIQDILLHYGDHDTLCTLATHDQVQMYRRTYNNIPWVETPMFTLEDDSLLVFVDPILMTQEGYTPTNNSYTIDLTYIKRPKQFDYTQPDDELDLPEDVMHEIINRAVIIALENIESQRTSGKAQLTQLSE